MPVLNYCATLNNYSTEDWNELTRPNSKLQYIIVGKEVGESGTPHLQIYFQLAKQCKLQTIKNWGGPWKKMHLESARGTPEQASTYCKKDGDFIEIGEMKVNKPGQRTDLDSVKEAIDRGETYDEVVDANFSVASRCHKFIKERIQARDSNKQVAILRERLESASLRPWQQILKDVVEEEANPRAIHWIWCKNGSSGKSWMARYLVATKGAAYLTFGKKSDLAYIYAGNQAGIVVINLSRTANPGEEDKNRSHFMDGLYSLAEDLKDGMMVSTKYESRTLIFDVPHVIFFANFEPDYTKWSADRYLVKELD